MSQNTSIQMLLYEINNSSNEALKTQKLSQLAQLMAAEMNKIIEEELTEELEDEEGLEEEEGEEDEEDLEEEEGEEDEEDLEDEEEENEKKKKKKGKAPTIAEVIADEGKFAILASKFQAKFGLTLLPDKHFSLNVASF